MAQLQVQIKSIARHRTPNPNAPGGFAEWVGSGPVLEHETWRATVALYGDGVKQTQNRLLDGRSENLAVTPEDLVELSIE
jgi:hypothetical protein